MTGDQVGAIYYDARIDTSGLRKDAAMLDTTVDGVTKSTGTRFSGMAAVIGKSSLIASAGIAAMGAALSFFAKDAVLRVDTLNNFPKVMSNMGITADDAAKASRRLVDGIDGLPTTLDTATLAVQRLTSKTQNVAKSTDIFLALNNAILAGGAPMELQATALEQFSQSFAKGKPDMMEWRSIMAAMPAQLDQVAKSMGLVSADQLGEKLRDGTVTMEQFSDEIIKLNSNGVGGLPTLAEQAANATKGIGTSMQNARTAVVKAIAQIITAIGAERIAGMFNKIKDSIKVFADFVSNNLAPIGVFIGTILTIAFYSLASAVISATWPVLAIAAGVTALYLLFQKFKPQIDFVVAAFMQFWEVIKPIREFIANQLVTAWNQLKVSIDSMMASLQPFIPQLKILGIIIGAVVVVPILLFIATIGIAIAVVVAIITVVARLIGWFSQLQAAFWEVAGAIQQGVNNQFGRVLEFFRGLPGAIVSAVGNLGSLLYNAGKSLVTGFINGIKDAFGSVKETLGNLTSKLTDWKGPMSLDKVILERSGQAVINGFVKGLESQYSTVKSSLTGITGELGGDVNSQISMSSIDSVGGGISGSSNQVSITLNLSGIMSRSKADERTIAKGLVESINEELRAKQLPEIGGGALRGAV